MPYFDKALSEAKSQGYKDYWETSGSSTQKHYSEILLDPEFFIAYGKARGWGETEIYDMITGEPKLTMYWRYQQYRFIDHLAERKDINTFFKQFYE